MNDVRSAAESADLRASAWQGVLDAAQDAGGVLATWALLLLLENLGVAAAYREEFSGSWEISHARYQLTPVALAALIPAAFAVVGLARLVAHRKARTLALLAVLAGGAVAYGISNGRHFSNMAVRAPFVVALAALAGAVVFVLAKKLPLGRPSLLAALGAIVSVGSWLTNAFVWPRLYPAFHAALLATTLVSWASLWMLVRANAARTVRVAVATLGGLLAFGACLRAPGGAKTIAKDDNLRRILVEHAPILGKAVTLAAYVAPPPPLDDDPTGEASTVLTRASLAPGRTLDWTGRDIVLLTVDALRADHLSAYGYERKTTPNIDRLAERGTLFSRAYCPTPHTSYSITSLMTGKYMRPLLSMGVNDESETWADHLRRYGFRTAAFYPPAVFFIDAHRFTDMQKRALGFEYAKEEFAGRSLRAEQVSRYLDAAPTDKPLFLWIHAFEPHEPYEAHAEFPFSGQPAVDAYDSEIREADALFGEVIDLLEKRRPGAVFMFTADHGEEFGDHGGRYHGTSVYEEQVRVPLVVVGPGVEKRVVDTPVQTIDLLPTTLSALDVPTPAQIRGRDLGPLLTGKAPADDKGLAFAETDDYTLVAQGSDRLVCARKVSACSLFDVANDPAERRPIGDRPERVRELRRLTAAIERENGKLEASALPEALRRGLQGDREAAEDVLPLFDDVRVSVRRAAAQCAFRLRASEMLPQLRRAMVHDEDPEVRDWSALALARIDEEMTDGGEARTKVDDDARIKLDELLTNGAEPEKTAAALVFAERGDGRGQAWLLKRWSEAFTPNAKIPGEFDEARELLGAFAKVHAKAAVPLLISSLEDLRLRPYVIDALVEIGDARAKGPLLRLFTEERYVHMRAKEARALVAFGAREELRAPLARFAGVPEPMPEALAVAEEAGLLEPEKGGYLAKKDAAPPSSLDLALRVPGDGAARLYIRDGRQGQGQDTTAPVVRIGNHEAPVERRGDRWIVEWPAGAVPDAGKRVDLHLEHRDGVQAAWLVRRAEEIAPPPPVAWSPDGGAAAEVDGGPDGGT